MHRYVLALLIVASPFSAFAAEVPKEGSYDYTSCWSGVNNVITFSKTHTASSFEMTGTNRSNPPGGVFDKNTFRCVGMNSSLDGKITASTVCEAIDVDGDKRLTSFSTGDGKLTRTFVEELENTKAWSTRRARFNRWVRFRPSRPERFRTAIIKPARIS